MRAHSDKEIRMWHTLYSNPKTNVGKLAAGFGVKANTMVRGFRSLGLPLRSSGFLPFNSRGLNGKDPIEQAYAWFYRHAYQRRAKRKGLAFTISLTDFITIVKSPCHYCGALSTSETRKVRHLRIPMLTVDRFDSGLGYIPNNCVSACKKCNVMKPDLSYSEFIDHISKILGKAKGL